jgi:hypothetical protein
VGQIQIVERMRNQNESKLGTNRRTDQLADLGLRGGSSATLTEVFPYFALSCKANARV